MDQDHVLQPPSVEKPFSSVTGAIEGFSAAAADEEVAGAAEDEEEEAPAEAAVDAEDEAKVLSDEADAIPIGLRSALNLAES